MTKAEAAALRAENETLRLICADLAWMARRYCNGRSSYATHLFNQHTRTLLKLGVPLDPTADGTLWARDGMGRAYDGLSDEEAAQGEPLREIDVRRDTEIEALRQELHRLRAELARRDPPRVQFGA